MLRTPVIARRAVTFGLVAAVLLGLQVAPAAQAAAIDCTTKSPCLGKIAAISYCWCPELAMFDPQSVLADDRTGQFGVTNNLQEVATLVDAQGKVVATIEPGATAYPWVTGLGITRYWIVQSLDTPPLQVSFRQQQVG